MNLLDNVRAQKLDQISEWAVQQEGKEFGTFFVGAIFRSMDSDGDIDELLIFLDSYDGLALFCVIHLSGECFYELIEDFPTDLEDDGYSVRLIGQIDIILDQKVTKQIGMILSQGANPPNVPPTWHRLAEEVFDKIHILAGATTPVVKEETRVKEPYVQKTKPKISMRPIEKLRFNGGNCPRCGNRMEIFKGKDACFNCMRTFTIVNGKAQQKLLAGGKIG